MSAQPVDYDSLQAPFFNLTVFVSDPNTEHVDEAYIEIYVTDYNDNPPSFVDKTQSATLYENIPRGTSVARFRAIDRDSGKNRQFTLVLFLLLKKSIYHKLRDASCVRTEILKGNNGL